MEQNFAEVQGVGRTLLLPLWGRWSESRKPDGLIHDRKCLELVEAAALDFSALAAGQNPVSRLAWVARARHIDRELAAAMAGGGDLTVLCLGAGLDTAWWRMAAKPKLWYDLDLPEVVGLRRAWLGEEAGCRLIAGSALEASSYAPIRIEGRLLILAVGLLYYFDRPQVTRVIGHLAGLLGRSSASGGGRASATVLIDWCSAQGVAIANKSVLQDQPDARMVWSAENDAELAALHPAITGVESWGVFTELLPLLKPEDARMAALSDQLRLMSFARIQMSV